MDVANQENGLVIGTGDLSELALGWATYNGDHMSMYGVNGSIPKTLVKYLVEWVANNKVDEASRATLLDIVDTPISPELIPADEHGNIKQKTEDLVLPVRAARFLPLSLLTLRSLTREDLFLGEAGIRGNLRRCHPQEMAPYLLPPLLPATVQAQLPAGRPESRFHQPLPTWRLANAERRNGYALAG